MENHDRCSIPHFRTFQRGFMGGKIEVREGFITLQRRKSGIRVGAARSSAQKEATGPSDRMPRWGKEKERHVAIHRTQGPLMYIQAPQKCTGTLQAQREISGERERRNIKRRKLALLRVACGINHMCSHSSESPEARSPPALLFVGATRR